MTSETDRATGAMWACACPSDYDAWFKLLCAVKDAGVPKDEARHWCESGEGFVAADFESKWERGIKEGGAIKAASLFATAFAQGWKDPSKSRTKGSRPNHPIAKPSPSPAMPVKQAANNDMVKAWGHGVAAHLSDSYIDLKQGKPDGLRIYPTSAPPLSIRGQNVGGYLMLPCYAPDGVTLVQVQFIPPGKGDKLNFKGASFGDGFFPVGDIASAKKIYIVEGWGQSQAVTKADPASAAAVSFGAGRMGTVAKVLRGKYPDAKLVICPDRGMEDKAAKIAADVAGLMVEMPTDKPGNYDTNDYLLEHGTGALSALLERATEPPIEYALSVAFADELTNEFTPPDEIVEGVLTAGDGSVVYGDTNSGKTFFVIDLACAVARGVPWMGKQTEPGLVIYLAAESPASVRSRIQAYQRHHGVRVPNFAIVQSPIDLFDGDADTDKLIQLVKQIEWQKRQPARLIIGDTLARLSAGANENAGQDMGLVVRRFDRIRAECKAHFLLIHHSGKNVAAGARGWSGVRAAVDTEIEVTDSPAGRCCEITKQRDLPTKGDRIGFKLQVVTMGLTKWKSPATSCVVMPADAPDKQSGKRISEVAGAVIEYLTAKGSGVKKTELVKHFDDRYTKGACYREIKKLVAAGLLHECAGIVAAISFAGGAK